MLSHEDARLDHVKKLLAVGGQLPSHLAGQDPNDDPSEFAEELGILEDAKAQARLARDGDYEITMANGRQAFKKVGRCLLGSALSTGRANSGLAALWDSELIVARAAREASDSKFLSLHIPGDSRRPSRHTALAACYCRELAVAGHDKRLHVVYEDGPKRAEKCVALAILTPASRQGREGKSKRHQTLGSPENGPTLAQARLAPG